MVRWGRSSVLFNTVVQLSSFQHGRTSNRCEAVSWVDVHHNSVGANKAMMRKLRRWAVSGVMRASPKSPVVEAS
jgi:hypothetical protein